ncbi:hypothetical protein Oweho_3195 [Owenweeksia hongkongensis DSM 17368]|uniref:Uncharacterized protein n=1 Tax=Owenweeksia hongkongensis (strain DSM 17368 / CIP 108786 / JCM 12287 / NRRL B-23963 / UST20020801) TaxID=926562 RepID=G8R3Q9_OWEHD|nr:hypothetical protein [Owenweeksia hongkongensis]AEV34146.1 hypothetical protein Oweho_3195 [Owenweeksia hongkongensis DSM 17368]
MFYFCEMGRKETIDEKEIKHWYWHVISQRGIYKELGVKQNDVANWRKMYRNPKCNHSIGHMLYVLNLSGALKLGYPMVGEL